MIFDVLPTVAAPVEQHTQRVFPEKPRPRRVFVQNSMDRPSASGEQCVNGSDIDWAAALKTDLHWIRTMIHLRVDDVHATEDVV